MTQTRAFALAPTAWVTIQTVSQQLVAVVILAVQAPILGPRAFGLFAVVMVFIGFCEFVVGSAATEALISIRRIEDRHFHAMTGITLLISLLLGAAAFAAAPGLAKIFGDADLAPVLRWMAVLPLLSAFSAAPLAATKREMQFRPTALRGIAGTMAGGAVGLTLALLGAGVWALVWQALVQRAVAVIVLWRIVPLRFGLSLSSRHLGDLKQFAATVALSRMMNWASAQLPRLILGLFLGTTELGLFALAARLNDIVSQVALEPRATVARVDLRRWADDVKGLETAAQRLFMQMSVICFPLCIGGAAIMPVLFHTWLNAHWSGAIVPAQLMLLMGLPCVTFYCASALFMALNHQASEAFVSTVQTVTAALVTLVFAPLGLTIATAAIAARPLALMPLPVALLNQRCGISGRAMLRAQLPALLAASLMGSTVWLLNVLLEPGLSGVVELLMLVAAGAVVYVFLLAALLPELVGQLLGHRSTIPVNPVA